MSESLPLTGIRILEFTHAVMGPAAGLILADMGAEVIRIEPSPQGDHTRQLKGFGTGYYTFFNRNKKSLAVNLKSDIGKEIARSLLDTADGLIENFAPGTMDRLGLGYNAVTRTNPRLIYCSLKGFMNGPYVNRSALDEVVQMMAGLAYMTGPPGQPLRAGASVVDIAGGMFGAIAILGALRERDQTGRGQLVQNGLFETAAFIMGQHMTYSAISQKEVPPMPARVSAWAVYRLFDTADDQQIFVGITSNKHWQAFCREFDRPDLLADESLSTNNARISARDRLHPELEAMLGALPAAAIVEKCERAEIPFSPVARPEDLFEDAQLIQGESLVESALPDGRTAKLPKLPIALYGKRLELRSSPPVIGEHTSAIMTELGYDNARIRALHDEETIVASEFRMESDFPSQGDTD